jgi:hypothetical protein
MADDAFFDSLLDYLVQSGRDCRSFWIRYRTIPTPPAQPVTFRGLKCNLCALVGREERHQGRVWIFLMDLLTFASIHAYDSSWPRAKLFPEAKGGKLKFTLIEEMYESCHPLVGLREKLEACPLFINGSIGILEWFAKDRLRERLIGHMATCELDVAIEKGPPYHDGHEWVKSFIDSLDDPVNAGILQEHGIKKSCIVAAVFA